MQFHEVASLFPLMEGEEFKEFINDIRINGQKEPIWIYENKIVDGRNRYRACQELNISPISKQWDGKGSLISFVVSLNLKRRHLTSSQKATIAVEIEPALAEEAKKRQGERTDLKPDIVQIIAPSNEREENKARSQAGQLTHTNRQYVSDAKAIKEKAPKVFEEIKSGTINIPDAKRIINLPEEKQQKLIQDVKEGKAKNIVEARRKEKQAEFDITLKNTSTQESLNNKYRCIVIDPPWPVQKIIRDTRPNQAEFEYPTMSIEEIKTFSLPEIAHENCHLYLWVTHKFLPDAFEIIKHWGFKYQCLLTWVKNVGFTPFSWMYSTEHILFCRKGSLDLLKKGIRLDFTAKVREHSRKPDKFYKIISQASPEPRIDVFSREKREGFTQYGNEVSKF